MCRLGKGAGKYLGGVNAHFALLLGGQQQQFSTDRFTAIGPSRSGGVTVEEWSFCCESKMLETLHSVWVDTVGSEGLEWQLTAALCLFQMLHPALGSKTPNNKPTTQRAQHKALRTAVHHTACGTQSACVPVSMSGCVCICGGETARKNRSAPQSVRMQQPDDFFLSCSDFNHRRLNPTSFRSDPKIKLYPSFRKMSASPSDHCLHYRGTWQGPGSTHNPSQPRLQRSLKKRRWWISQGCYGINVALKGTERREEASIIIIRCNKTFVP